MPSFLSDNEDLQFYFDRGLDWPSLARACGVAPAEVGEAVQVYRDIAALVGELAAEEVAPRAARIDREGARLADGEAVPSPAMEEIFERLKALDLHRLPLPAELGGLGAPILLYFISGEMLARGDVSVMIHHSFFAGIAMALLAYSTVEGTTSIDKDAGRVLSTRFAKEIEEIARGDAWGSMDITEPDAGSDMAALRTTGVQAEDGSWTISGQKIFITSGHGKYHLVIARTEEGGEGLAGLSMFLVKAYEDRPDGTRVRHVTIDRVEEKLGHHGSVTTALTFDRTPAQLIGRRGEGFRYMLMLMNNARLGVGFESLGLCEAAYRLAREYAEQRRSMGKAIARHEIIADYLDEMRTDLQGIRALAMHAAYHEEMGRRLSLRGSADERMADHQARARRATPLLKYLAAEKAVEMARRCVQIHGGIGYMREVPAEKLLRDAIVMPIYEGTSQIQSLMAMKDVFAGMLRRPQAFLTRVAQARWRSMSAKDELERRVARLQALSLSTQRELALRTATTKLRTLASVPVTGWARALTKNWDPKRDFAFALLHAERLTRVLCDEQIAEILLEQARRFPERRELLERWLERAEPRCRALHTEITTIGTRLLAQLAAPLEQKKIA